MKRQTRKHKKTNKIPVLFKDGYIAFANIRVRTKKQTRGKRMHGEGRMHGEVRMHGGIGVIDSLVDFTKWVMSPTIIPIRNTTGVYVIADEPSRVKPSNNQWMIYVDDNYTFGWTQMFKNTFDSVDMLLDRLSSNANPPVPISKKLDLL